MRPARQCGYRHERRKGAEAGSGNVFFSTEERSKLSDDSPKVQVRSKPIVDNRNLSRVFLIELFSPIKK